MRNISTTHVMSRRARQFQIAGMVVLLAGLVLLSLGILSLVIPLYRADWYSATQVILLVLGGLVGLGGLALILYGLRFPRDNPDALRMADFLARFLDYRYTFIRNISRRGLGYVDALLIGPNGVLVFYFFKGKGEFYSERKVWFNRASGQLRPLDSNPTQEAVKDVRAVREYLKAHDLAAVPVYAVVVAAYSNTVIAAQQPVVPVSHMHNVQDALRENYLAQERIGQRQVHATVQVILDGLA